MEIFLTGGTGYIGRALLEEFLRAGHEVIALVRAPDRARDLEAAGARTIAGELNDPDSYRASASSADAIVHAAFDYDTGARGDASALDALLGAAASGGPESLLYTSGCWVLGDTGEGIAGEDAATDQPAENVTWRAGHERRVLDAASETLATAVIRPGIVYGGSGSLTAPMFETATSDGAAHFIGDGHNHWSLVHLADVARLFRTVLEEGSRGIFHAVDGIPIPVVEVAAAASRAAGAGGATRSVPLDEAREQYGPMADAMCLNQRMEAPRSKALGWNPHHASFLDAAGVACREWVASRSV
jgi:nucleoside-diphosphate-sugar epimerase